MTQENIPDERALTEGTEPPAPVAVSPPTRVLPTMQELGLMSAIARTLVNARGHAVPKDIDSPSKAAAVLLAGWELGLRPMTAFRHVYVVNGRTDVDAQVMMGLVKAKEPEADFIFHAYTSQACKVELRRPGRTPIVVEYTAEDAKASGQLDKPGPWKGYRRDMLAWAAVKRACKLGAPDIINAIPSVDVGDMPDVIEYTAGDIGQLPDPGPEEVQQAMLDDEVPEDEPEAAQPELPMADAAHAGREG